MHTMPTTGIPKSQAMTLRSKTTMMQKATGILSQSVYDTLKLPKNSVRIP